jgi:hypothetical protein
MKCPNKCRGCEPIFNLKLNKDNFICSCIKNKGTKYKKDIIWLCLSGVLSKTSLEMTKFEATSLIAALSNSLVAVSEV